MLEILFIGFLLGMRHAIESDHVAAVASLVTRSSSISESIRLGSVWGVGHTITLFIFGSAVMLLDNMIPEQIAMMLEFFVAIMLVVLGVDVLRRAMKKHLHFHAHQHQNGTVHFHAHTHINTTTHTNSDHEHRHPSTPFPMRALLVGIMHGMAGSAALIVLTLQSVHSFSMGLIYITLFGIGSIAGMALLSIAIILPLRHTSTRYNGLYQYLLMGIGTTTIFLGCSMMVGITNNGLFL
ncbi:urease accessory protein [Mariprofundus sp. EBB-1]|uniref:urease accessory protein n=1 Tax=Mariprofundus sp. EBB-1 TaxID=2650971 RepID=UPI000EF1DC10|nr:urease accessory protein [Mariprofundus sp. EBB-1]RLL54334.1 urease accessory protein [Mariprofundus sp. EBB-1]